MTPTDKEINYLPYFGEVLPDGSLNIPTFGCSPSGEKWAGRVVVPAEHPNFTLWLSQINNQAAYHAAVAEEQKRAGEQRRQESRERRQERQP